MLSWICHLFRGARAALPGTAPADAASSSFVQFNGSQRESFESDPRLLQIARQAIGLSADAPRLAQLATELEQAARQQSETAAAVARSTEEITRLLDGVMGRLEGSAEDISGLLRTVSRISDHIRILALNAGIEAARAGEHGRAFAVVASEVQRLADETSRANTQVETFVTGIRADVQGAGEIVGQRTEATPEAQGRGTTERLSVHALNARMRSVESSATSQLQSASRVDEVSRRVRQLSEELVLCVGTFRTDAHQTAAHLLEGLLNDPRLLVTTRETREACLREFVRSQPGFELAYQTDARGRQITGNIWQDTSQEGQNAFGSDWSQRPWFRSAVVEKTIAVSNVYRSVASDRFCLTVSAPVFGPDGKLAGVVAADVDFLRLLDLINSRERPDKTLRPMVSERRAQPVGAARKRLFEDDAVETI